MKDVTNANFGLLIAYVLPGFVTLWGISLFSGTVRDWLGTSSDRSPTVGGFLYVTLAAVAAGLFVSTIRWAVIDQIHHRTGIREPRWDFAALHDKLAALDLLIANHYRYYQAHANLFIAVAFAFAAFAIAGAIRGTQAVGSGLMFVFVEWILWIGSRDTIRKYYLRVDELVRLSVDDGANAGKRGRSADGRINGLKIEGPFR